MDKNFNSPKRTCSGCTKCCEGWLQGTAHGKSFYPGSPCHFVQLGKKCSIYENRPLDPCIQYSCEWLKDESFPEWLKPNLSDVIISKKTKPIEYYQVIEAGKKIDSAVLNWLILWSLQNKVNILYLVDGGVNKIGTKEFIEAKDL